MTLKPYAKYKDSGVEWLGKVPEHWDVKAIKWASAVQRGASPRPIDDPKYFDDDGEYAWVRIADVTASSEYLEKTEQRLSALGSSLSVKMNPDSLFLSIAGTVGKPCISKIKCCIHDGFVYFPLWNGSTKFLYYIFASGEPYKGLGKMGTQLNLNTDTVGGIVIGLPDLTEQTAIATYLDQETARIDELITYKTRFIELLKEKRSALITHAVTKGLNPNAKMKDSGVEWLGRVPEHWEVKSVYSIATVRNGHPFASELFKSDGVESDRLIRIRDISGDNDAVFTEESCPANANISNGDVLIGMDGEFNVHRWMRGPAKLNQRMCAISGQTEEVTQFLSRCLPINLQVINDLAYATTVKHLSSYELLHTRIAVPQKDELAIINAYLDQETARIDELVQLTEQSISLIKERRSALITAAVTGKIDVSEQGTVGV